MILLGHNINFCKKSRFVEELDTLEKVEFHKCQSYEKREGFKLFTISISLVFLSVIRKVFKFYTM